jgi:hypothetical protein
MLQRGAEVNARAVFAVARNTTGADNFRRRWRFAHQAKAPASCESIDNLQMD